LHSTSLQYLPTHLLIFWLPTIFHIPPNLAFIAVTRLKMAISPKVLINTAYGILGRRNSRSRILGRGIFGRGILGRRKFLVEGNFRSRNFGRREFWVEQKLPRNIKKSKFGYSDDKIVSCNWIILNFFLIRIINFHSLDKKSLWAKFPWMKIPFGRGFLGLKFLGREFHKPLTPKCLYALEPARAQKYALELRLYYNLIFQLCVYFQECRFFRIKQNIFYKT